MKVLLFIFVPENIFHIDTIYEITMNPLIYSLNICLLNTYPVLVDTRDTGMNKTGRGFSPNGTFILQEENRQK